MTSVASQLLGLGVRTSIGVTFHKSGAPRSVVGQTQAYCLISADSPKPHVRPIDPSEYLRDGQLDLRGIAVVHVQNDVRRGSATVRDIVANGFRGAFLVQPTGRPAIVVLTDVALLAEAHKRAEAMRAQTAKETAAAQRAREDLQKAKRQRRRALRNAAVAVVPEPIVLDARPTDYWTEISILQGPAAISLEPVQYHSGDSIMKAYPALMWSSAQKDNVYGILYCDSAEEAAAFTELTRTELLMLLGNPVCVN